MQDLEAIALLKKYLAGNCTEQERGILETWYLQYYQQDLPDLSETSRLQLRQEVWAALPIHQEEIQITPTRKLQLWPKVAIIAAAVATIVFGIWFFSAPRHPDAGQHLASAQHTNDVAPGKNTATLTFANGKTIALSEAKTGVAFNANEIKYNDGSNVDSLSSLLGGTTNQSQLFTATTPRGGQYQFTLPDGTKVWLNAASTLKFPSSFAGLSSRKVELTSGEAYFEVAKVTQLSPSGRDGRRPERVPFIVTTSGQQVKVLGTHFNISNYPEERMVKTTLLEGSVQVSSLRGGTTKQSHLDNVVATLKPGQQTLNNGNDIQVKPANVEIETAWMKNDFDFRGESLESVMQKVARWYDIQVVYTDDNIKTLPLVGQISRTRTLSAVMERILAAAHLQFTIEGKTVTIMPELKK